MSSLSEIRTNLHNKVQQINPEELFRTPYKPFVQVIVDNKETSQSFRELKAAVRTMKTTRSSSTTNPKNLQLESFQLKYVKAPKHKTRSDVSFSVEQKSRTSSQPHRQPKQLNTPTTMQTVLPSIDHRRFKRCGRPHPKKLKTNWQEVETKLFQVDSSRFHKKVEDATRQFLQHLA